MCGEIPPGHFGHTVCIRLLNNNPRAIVSLGKQLEHIVEIRLDEYAVTNPNGGAISPSLWTLRFENYHFYAYQTTNAGGKTGHRLVIDNAAATHIVYDRPRILSHENEGKLNKVQLEVTDETGADVTFTDATFFITFVCKIPHWTAEEQLEDDATNPRNANLPFSTRPRFFM